jgi:hypothetical protein
MSKLTVDDIVPGELYVFTDTNPDFSHWVGLIIRAMCRYDSSRPSYLFEIVELPDGARNLGYKIGALLPVDIRHLERYPLTHNASDQLFI